MFDPTKKSVPMCLLYIECHINIQTHWVDVSHVRHVMLKFIQTNCYHIKIHLVSHLETLSHITRQISSESPGYKESPWCPCQSLNTLQCVYQISQNFFVFLCWHFLFLLILLQTWREEEPCPLADECDFIKSWSDFRGKNDLVFLFNKPIFTFHLNLWRSSRTLE